MSEQVGKRLLFGSTCSAIESGMVCEWRSLCKSQLRRISLSCACPQRGEGVMGRERCPVGERHSIIICISATHPTVVLASCVAPAFLGPRERCQLGRHLQLLQLWGTSVGASGRSPERWPELRGLPSTSLAQGRPPMSPDFVNKYEVPPSEGGAPPWLSILIAGIRDVRCLIGCRYVLSSCFRREAA